MIVGSATVLVNVRAHFEDVNRAINSTRSELLKMDDNQRSRALSMQREWKKVTATIKDTAKSLVLLSFRLEFLVPTLGYIAGAIGSVVGGLYSMIGVLARAGPAIATIGTAAVGLVTGLGALVLAFSGVGDAITSLWQAQDKTSAGIQKNTEEMYQRQVRIVDAQRAVIRAQENAVEAQKALNDARKEAIQDLIDLNFQLEDNAISEERALMAVEDARAALEDTAGLAGGSRERREAELAYREAVLNLRQIRSEGKQLSEEQQDAQQKGIEGSDAVADAQRRVRDTQQELIDSQQELTKALIQSTEASNDFNKASQKLAGLTPAAREFAIYIASLRPIFQQLQNAAGVDLFPRLAASINILVSRALPSLTVALRTAGAAIGDMFVKLSTALTSTTSIGQFRQIVGYNAVAAGSFSNALASLAQAFLALSAAAGPLLVTFARWLERVTAAWNASLQLRSSTGELTNQMYQAGAVIAQVGRITRNLWEYFKALATAGNAVGQSLLDTFEIFTRNAAATAQSAQKQAEMAQMYEGMAIVFKDTAVILKEIILLFGRLGAQPGIIEASNILRTQLLPTLTEIFITGSNMAPVIARILSSMAQLFLTMQNSGIFHTLFNILDVLLQIVNTLFKIPGVTELVSVLIFFNVFARVLKMTSVLIGGLIPTITAVGDVVVWFFELFRLPTLTAMMRSIWMTLVYGFGSVGKAIGAVGLLVVSFAASFRSVADTWKGSWQSIVNTASAAVGFLTNLFQGFLNFTINPVISGLNLIPGVNIPRLQFATGGVVPGYAPGMDVVPAMLSPGEGVLVPQAVRALGGPSAIQQLNNLSANNSFFNSDSPKLSSAINSLVSVLQRQGGRGNTYVMQISTDRSLDTLMDEFRRYEGAA